MRWDEVERELFIVSRDLQRLGKTFAAMAAALWRERENSVTPRGVTRDDPPEPQDKDRPP